MKMRIKSARANTAVNSNSGANYEHVVRHNLANPGREEYEVLVLSAPSKDILDDSTIQASSSNLIKIAEEALKFHSNLKKVIILEHTPRFDNMTNGRLSKKANEILIQLRENSDLKNSIVIGKHSLADYGIGRTHSSR